MSRTFAKTGSVPLPWGRLFYRRTPAQGTPLVLLHPLALGSRLWESTLDKIGEGRDVIAVDLRGHGESEWDGIPFSIADLAQDVMRLLESLDVHRCDIVGMSMGGCVAMSVAAMNPRLTRNLSLCDTTAWYGSDGPAAWEQRALGAERKPRAELLPFQIKRWFNEGFVERCPEVVRHVVDIFLRTPAACHAQACRALGAFDGRPLLGAVEANTLVLTGEEDYATPPEMGQALSQAIPRATFRLWPGVRHFSVLESAELRTVIARHVDRE
jgi:3-oxoadipate enol-lactonase